MKINRNKFEESEAYIKKINIDDNPNFSEFFEDGRKKLYSNQFCFTGLSNADFISSSFAEQHGLKRKKHFKKQGVENDWINELRDNLWCSQFGKEFTKDSFTHTIEKHSQKISVKEIKENCKSGELEDVWYEFEILLKNKGLLATK